MPCLAERRVLSCALSERKLARRLLFGFGVVALLSSAGCVGASPPPRKDLFSAVEKSITEEAMFEFALEARLAMASPSLDAFDGEQDAGRAKRAEVYVSGSSRPEKGYRALVVKRPPLWSEAESRSHESMEAPLVLEEVPGAVTKPGSLLWFSGRSGAMDAFGPLAFAIPPLGSPDTVFARTIGLLRTLPEPVSGGTAEVRAHPTDVYFAQMGPLRAGPPKDAARVITGTLERSGGSSDKAGGTTTPTSTRPPASVSPSPTSYDGTERLGLEEAVWRFGVGRPSEEEVTEVASSEVTYSISVRAFVDHIDGRMRRLETNLSLTGSKVSASLWAAADFWGYDPIGEFKIPVDTTFVTHSQQQVLRSLEFKPQVPGWLPPGIEFAGMESPDLSGPASRCRPVHLMFTGRGREGYVELSQAKRGCGVPTLMRPPDVPPASTETASGASLEVQRGEERSSVRGTARDVEFVLVAETGVSISEAIQIAESLQDMDIPIPAELALPPPKEGPERR